MNDIQEGYVSTGERKLHYLRAGGGKKLLLAFHGYGNDASLFLPFVKHLDSEFTLISVDLPHHGGSQWETGVLMEKAELLTLARNLQKETGADKVSLLGYSLGARVCMCIMEQMPERIERAVLVAPDGLVYNTLYHFVTRNFIGKRIFRNFLHDPARYTRYTKWLMKSGLVNESQHNFAMYFLQNEDSRMFLLKVWSDLNLLIPDRPRLKVLIRKYKLPVDIFMGAYDRIIPVKQAKQFKGDLETVHIHVLEKGHKIFDNETVAQISQYFLD